MNWQGWRGGPALKLSLHEDPTIIFRYSEEGGYSIQRTVSNTKVYRSISYVLYRSLDNLQVERHEELES